MALFLYVLGDVFEDIPVVVPFQELGIDFLLAPDDNEIPHLPIVPFVCLGLAGGEGLGGAIHGSQQCPWGLGISGWVRVCKAGVGNGRLKGWQKGWTAAWLEKVDVA